MTDIPRSHPRAESLLVRKRLVEGFERGLVAREGLLAQGRGEAFDYLLGERTGEAALRAIRAAAAMLLLAEAPVISVNGNVAALCPEQMVRLARASNAKLEVNLFYDDMARRRAVAKVLEESGAAGVLGAGGAPQGRLAGVDSARGSADRDGILAGDVIVVPLEDGDRTGALKSAGKKVITFDLNPLSRTAEAADITIVDNITRAAGLLAAETEGLAGTDRAVLEGIVGGFENRANLASSTEQIRENLARRAGIA